METKIKVIQFSVYADSNDNLTKEIDVNSLMFNDEEINKILDTAFEEIQNQMEAKNEK